MIYSQPLPGRTLGPHAWEFFRSPYCVREKEAPRGVGPDPHSQSLFLASLGLEPVLLLIRALQLLSPQITPCAGLGVVSVLLF